MIPEISPRRRTRRGEETRHALVLAAIECLSERGYAATSIEAVMERSGISRGSVLHQFPTRLDLILSAVEAAMEAMMADSRSRLRLYADPIARYRAMSVCFWETLNIPQASAVTEALLAARWDGALAEALRPLARRIEGEIDEDTRRVARAAGAREIEASVIHVRVLVLALRGITLELMFDRERQMIHRALEQIHAHHLAHCEDVLGAQR